MNNIPEDKQEESQLVAYLIDRICDRAAGRNDAECKSNYPHDVYFLGNLRPKNDDDDEASDNYTSMRELVNKLAPVAFGADFCIHPFKEEIFIDVKIGWACYYRVLPTLQQQREHQQQQSMEISPDMEGEVVSGKDGLNRQQIAIVDSTTQGESGEPSEEEDSTILEEEEHREQTAEKESPEVVESATDRRSRRRSVPKDSLFICFRKIMCEATGRIGIRIATSGKEKWTIDERSLIEALKQETIRAQQAVLSDPLHIRTGGRPEERINVPEHALASQEAYDTFLRSLHTDVVPEWLWEVRTEVRPSGLLNSNDCVLQIQFVNISPLPEKAPNTEAFFFDAISTFTFYESKVQPFELDLAPKGFRYDRELWGRGFNCAVERVTDTLFVTAHTPIYEQKRYATQSEPHASFADLAQNPLPTLRKIVDTMRDFLPEWKDARQKHHARSEWNDSFEEEFNRDQQKFIEEIDRFRRGCELIRTNRDVRLAFCLTNETFRRTGDHPLAEKRKDAWRLFQIVFLVSQIPGIAALATADSADLAERDMVDIIYFPTGGGKTEAYLGTIVFHCFFDRLRGKAAGVTAWTRFPLRLLTLQQTQRVADVIGVADIVRRQHSDQRLSGSNIDGFAIGYLVGAEATPNEILNPTNYSYAKVSDQLLWSKANDKKERQHWKRVFLCPSCQTKSVEIDFDVASVRVIHRCTQPNCAFPEHVIPVYVVDNEIYRYLPSVIVGTIDKLAGVGNQRKLAQVFGQVDGRCLDHGYYKKKCCQKDCAGGRRLKSSIPQGLSGPTLFVQDELHLLKEGLGTFDAHYETFVQQLQKAFGQKDTLKIIASSATIEAFERQIAHLYGRRMEQARVFPGNGPEAGRSFYAETRPYAQRLFVGMIPHNKTIFNTILELVEYYHREVQMLQHLLPGNPNPYGGKYAPATDAWYQLLDYYATSLTYFLANRELNSIRTDLNGDTSPRLYHEGLTPLEIRELTGSTSTDDVTRTLEYLEQPAGKKAAADVVLATNMISHGVDIDRFNAMIFYGMPRQNAEYIQASSRVGRSHIGIVFACLHPARERDQSHYSYFKKFHEFLGQLVEPVAINRWAKFSIQRTLPGLFMGILLQKISNRVGDRDTGRYYMREFVQKKISEGDVKPEDFIPLLEGAYLVPSANLLGEQEFRKEIRRHVKTFLEQIISGRGRYVSEVLIPRPMRSLRDVDEAIEIELDNDGTHWADRN